ncbi:MAG: Sir2 family NAD-dependent protein deacetylase [Bacteroidales bacterium]
MNEINQKLERATRLIAEADALFITAGAGMGVDSGLPDFRGNSGFWKAYPPIAKLGLSFNEMANPVWFEKNPEMAWAFYGHRLNLYRETKPHMGFKLLLKAAKEKQYGYFIFTSNVDGAFQKAGFDDSFIEECHGSIHHFQCIKPCSSEIWDASTEKVTVDLETFKALRPFPKCKKCGGISRPNILMFGDWNWLSHRSVEQGNRLNLWLETMLDLNAKVAIIEMGAGHAVPTVRLQSQRVYRSLNASFIRINPRDYDVPEGAIGLPFGALEGLEKIFSLAG